jgi:hypothetical protein
MVRMEGLTFDVDVDFGLTALLVTPIPRYDCAIPLSARLTPFARLLVSAKEAE